jgi:hypothetical protein
MRKFILSLLLIGVCTNAAAQVKISALPAATTPLSGSELLPCDQSGVTDKCTSQSIANLVTSGGNVSTSGSPAEYQIPVWVTGTTVGGITPSATSGEALISNGSSANPSFSASLGGVTSVNGSTIPASAGTVPGSTGSFTANDCVKVGSTSPLEIADAGAGCGTGGGGAVSSVSAGPSGSVSVSPTTGATVVDLASQSAGTVCANLTGSSAAPICTNTMPNLQAALVSANANILCASPGSAPVVDYSPTDTCGSITWGATVGILYLTPATGGSTLDGLVAGSSMQQIFIINAEAAGGADNILLANQSSADSTASNRFLAAGNLVIIPGGGVNCLYLAGLITRWWCH